MVQEVVTRSGNVYDFVHRFLKSKEHVRLRIENRTWDTPEKLQKTMKVIEHEINGDNVLHPSLSGIIYFFAPIRLARS